MPKDCCSLDNKPSMTGNGNNHTTYFFFNGDDWGMVQYGIVLPPFMLRIWPPRTFPVDVAAATKKINGTRPGKHTKSYGKSPLSMGKFTISMVIFHSYVKLPEGKQNDQPNPPESATRGRGSESGTPFFVFT